MGRLIKESQQRSTVKALNDICSLLRGNFLIAGVGSPLRRDDRAGLLFCEELSKRGYECLICEYGVENCLDGIIAAKPRTLIVVDAALFAGGSPGDVVVVSEEKVSSSEVYVSTHGIPLSAVINMLKSLGAVERVYLVGVYPKDLGLGLEVSREAAVAVNELVNKFVKCFESAGKRGEEPK